MRKLIDSVMQDPVGFGLFLVVLAMVIAISVSIITVSPCVYSTCECAKRQGEEIRHE